MEGTEVVGDVCWLRRCDPGVVAALDVDGEEEVDLETPMGEFKKSRTPAFQPNPEEGFPSQGPGRVTHEIEAGTL